VGEEDGEPLAETGLVDQRRQGIEILKEEAKTLLNCPFNDPVAQRQGPTQVTPASDGRYAGADWGARDGRKVPRRRGR
jgi:hypothetical protein